MASYPPSHPGAQGQVQTLEWLGGLPEGSAAPGKEGKTALSRSPSEAEADLGLERNPHRLTFKAAFPVSTCSDSPDVHEHRPQPAGAATGAQHPCAPHPAPQTSLGRRKCGLLVSGSELWVCRGLFTKGGPLGSTPTPVSPHDSSLPQASCPWGRQPHLLQPQRVSGSSHRWAGQHSAPASAGQFRKSRHSENLASNYANK